VARWRRDGLDAAARRRRDGLDGGGAAAALRARRLRRGVRCDGLDGGGAARDATGSTAAARRAA
jgi:hypothetical protein